MGLRVSQSDAWLEHHHHEKDRNVRRLSVRKKAARSVRDLSDGLHLQQSPVFSGRGVTFRMNHHLESWSENRTEALAVSEEYLETFELEVSRYRRVLYFVAHRVLGDHRDAEAAVQGCLLTVSRNVPSFEREGSLRGWLVRVLIDEALAMLRMNRIKSIMCSEVVPKSPNLS